MSARRVGPTGERLYLRLGGAQGARGRGLPTLLLLHGFTGTGRTWRPFAPRFGRAFRLLAPDALGHGHSDAPSDPRAYDLARTADRLADALADIDPRPVHVLGYSMGGRTALHLAIRHPDRVASLVLEGASPGIEDPDERRRRRAADEALARLVEEEGIDAFVARWEAQPLFASQSSLPETVRLRQRQVRLGQRASGLAMSLRGAGAGTQENLWPRLGEIRVPLLYVAGALDRRYAAVGERLAAMVPGSRFVEAPGAGHAVHLERPGAFARAAEGFWRSIGTGPPA